MISSNSFSDLDFTSTFAFNGQRLMENVDAFLVKVTNETPDYLNLLIQTDGTDGKLRLGLCRTSKMIFSQEN